MIPTKEHRTVIEVGNVKQGAKMGIAKGAEKWIIYLLRNGVYKFKVRSPIREYLVNAQDEHRKFKVKRPIEVTLPSIADSNFRVRDFAAGLLPAVYDDAGELVGGAEYYFGMYGASDKRETNDEAGFMGIGAKSGFAYTKEFTVISYKDGKKYTYLLYVDENDDGRPSLMDTSNTEEPNGVEIIIPVHACDMDEFIEEALDLMKYFKVKPIIKGLRTPHVWEEAKPLLEGSGWRLMGRDSYGEETHSVAIMGEIAYPINSEEIKQLSEWEKTMLDAGLELYFPIGAIHMTTNREELQLDPFTIDAIRTKLSEIRKVLTDTGQQRFHDCKSLVEAKTLFYEMLMTGESKDALKGLITEVEWNTIKIADNIIDLGPSGNLLTYTLKNATIRRTSYETQLKCHAGMKLYLDDTDGTEIMYRRRANTVMAQPGINVVYVLQVKDKDRLVEIGIDVDNLESYNAVVPTKLSAAGGALRVKTGVDLTKRDKHARKIFKLNPDKLQYRRSSASSYWDVATIDDTTEGLFIPIDRFKPSHSEYLPNKDGISQLSKIVRELETAGITVPDIYGVKKSDKNTFDDWFKATVEHLPTDDIALREEYENTNGYPLYYRALGFSTKSLPEGHPVKTYHDIREQATKLDSSRIEAKKWLRTKLYTWTKVTKEVQPSTKITDAYNEMVKQYPVLKWLKEASGKTRAQDLLEYIADVDLLNQKHTFVKRKAA